MLYPDFPYSKHATKSEQHGIHVRSEITADSNVNVNPNCTVSRPNEAKFSPFGSRSYPSQLAGKRKVGVSVASAVKWLLIEHRSALGFLLNLR